MGSNLEDPARQLRTALAELAGWGPLRASSLYRTEPLGDRQQPWYVNAVAELQTDLSAPELLRRLKGVERRAGRSRQGPRWGPRVLDLDLLLLGAETCSSSELELPHPGLARRRFVLEPLCELAPTARDPRSGRMIQELLQTLDDPLRVEKLERINRPAPSQTQGEAPDRPLEVEHR